MPHDEIFSLTGKTALITGGGSGIGMAIAHGLSDAGATIIVAGRREDVLITALGTRAGCVMAADLSDPDTPANLAQSCREQNLQPDILVNAAGVNLRKHADVVTPDEWHAMLYLNLTAPFFLAQKLVPHMISNNWGRIINIASLQSRRAFANGIAYGASKGGVEQLTRAMAEAWSGRGVNANALAPGFFRTELTEPVFSDPQLAAEQAAKTAIGRNGQPEDLVGPAVFLASQASQYVTGQIVYVDGGYSAK